MAPIKPIKQLKAKNAEVVRDVTLTFRLTKRLRALAELAAREKGVSLANYTESLLAESLKGVYVDRRDIGDEGPVNTQMTKGRLLTEIADELYDDDDATCFLKRLHSHSWALSREQMAMLDLIRTSHLLYPKAGIYNVPAIKEHWSDLSALVSGAESQNPEVAKLFKGVDVEFAVLSETGKVAMYRRDPEEFTRRSQAHIKRTKRGYK